MKNKKILIGIIFLIIISCVIVIMTSQKSNKELDFDLIEKNFTKQYSDIELRKLDKIDVLEYFGIDMNEKSLYLTDFKDTDKPFAPKNLLIIIQDDNLEENYDLLNQYINIVLLNSEDHDEIELFNNVILEKENNYLYLILGFDHNVKKVINYYLENSQ